MVFRYSYRSLISVLFFCTLDVLSLDVLTFAMLSLVTCMISPPVMLSPDIRHDIPDSYNYHDTGMMTWHLDYILICSSTNCTPDTSVLLILLICSCSFPWTDNYLINYEMRQFTSGRGGLTVSIYVRVYSGIRYVVQLNLPVQPEGLQMTKGSVGSLLPDTIMIKGIQ